MALKQLVLLDSVHSVWRSSRALRLPSARKMQAISREELVGLVESAEFLAEVVKKKSCLFWFLYIVDINDINLITFRFIKIVLPFGTFLVVKRPSILHTWKIHGCNSLSLLKRDHERWESKLNQAVEWKVRKFFSWLNLDGTRKWRGLKTSYQWGTFNMSCTIPRRYLWYLRLVNLLLEEQTMLEYLCTMYQ